MNNLHQILLDDDEIKLLIDNIYWFEDIKGSLRQDLKNIQTKLEKVIYDHT